MIEFSTLIDLTPDKIAELPIWLRDELSGSHGSADMRLHGWFFTSEADEESSKMFERLAEFLSSPMDKSNTQLTEENVEKLLGIFLSAARRPPIETEIEVDNASLRAEYLEETPFRRENVLTSFWKLAGKVFAVRWLGVDFYPDFQFDGEKPRPVVEKILAELPNDMTDWQIAMWFASGNGWLDGGAPQECLSDPDAVINAAQQLAHPAVG